MAEITGYWIQASAAGRCSVCQTENGKVLMLQFSHDYIRVCPECAESLRDLVTDALEE